jgi:hypothetical protein
MGARECSYLGGEQVTNALYKLGYTIKNILYILIPYSGYTSDVLMSSMELSSLCQICEQDLLNVI